MNATLTRAKYSQLDWIRLLMIGLTIAGLGLSAYLMWGYTVPGATLACGESSGCETVKNSPYANLAGIPLPVMGLTMYAGLLVLLMGQNLPAVTERGWSPYVALAVFGLALAGVLYSTYLTYVEFFVIFAVCRWCIASAIIMTAIFGLSLFNLRNTQSYSTGG
jgi:uncharacterized membrane protein